jgi:hypothetical protein
MAASATDGFGFFDRSRSVAKAHQAHAKKKTKKKQSFFSHTYSHMPSSPLTYSQPLQSAPVAASATDGFGFFDRPRSVAKADQVGVAGMASSRGVAAALSSPPPSSSSSRRKHQHSNSSRRSASKSKSKMSSSKYSQPRPAAAADAAEVTARRNARGTNLFGDDASTAAAAAAHAQAAQVVQAQAHAHAAAMGRLCE